MQATAIQWRTNSGYDSVLLVIGDSGHKASEVKMAFAPADKDEIAHILTDIGNLSDWQSEDEYPDNRPEDYGDLVLERSADGEVLHLHADLLRERISYWFRS